MTMAKNDSHETAVLVRPSGIASPARKDTSLLVDGVWYVTVPCPYHGTPSGHVDESISWEEAKTPHHAGVIADQRHLKCSVIDEAHELALAGLQEIAAAENLRDQQKVNVAQARERVIAHAAMLEADPKNAMRARELAIAQALLKRHEHGMLEAEKRVANTVADNER